MQSKGFWQKEASITRVRMFPLKPRCARILLPFLNNEDTGIDLSTNWRNPLPKGRKGAKGRKRLKARKGDMDPTP